MSSHLESKDNYRNQIQIVHGIQGDRIQAHPHTKYQGPAPIPPPQMAHEVCLPQPQMSECRYKKSTYTTNQLSEKQTGIQNSTQKSYNSMTKETTEATKNWVKRKNNFSIYKCQ